MILPGRKVCNRHTCFTFSLAYLTLVWVLTALANDQDPLHYTANRPFNRKGNNIQLFAPTKTRQKVSV